jgi:hypothetical protein
MKTSFPANSRRFSARVVRSVGIHPAFIASHARSARRASSSERVASSGGSIASRSAMSPSSDAPSASDGKIDAKNAAPSSAAAICSSVGSPSGRSPVSSAITSPIRRRPVCVSCSSLIDTWRWAVCHSGASSPMIQSVRSSIGRGLHATSARPRFRSSSSSPTRRVVGVADRSSSPSPSSLAAPTTPSCHQSCPSARTVGGRWRITPVSCSACTLTNPRVSTAASRTGVERSTRHGRALESIRVPHPSRGLALLHGRLGLVELHPDHDVSRTTHRLGQDRVPVHPLEPALARRLPSRGLRVVQQQIEHDHPRPRVGQRVDRQRQVLARPGPAPDRVERILVDVHVHDPVAGGRREGLTPDHPLIEQEALGLIPRADRAQGDHRPSQPGPHQRHQPTGLSATPATAPSRPRRHADRVRRRGPCGPITSCL